MWCISNGWEIFGFQFKEIYEIYINMPDNTSHTHSYMFIRNSALLYFHFRPVKAVTPVPIDSLIAFGQKELLAYLY